jgi:RTX calcium-binding nonapeptide repeat (4 copies)
LVVVAAAMLSGLFLIALTADAKRVVGTPGPDTLVGTPSADTLSGLGGGDLLDGRTGRDRLLGGAGADRIQAFDGVRDRVSCGGGRDLAAVDAADAVSSDCEVVSKQISRDTLSGGAGQHASEVEPDAAAHGSTVVAAFQVARFHDGGAMGIGWATSHDAGRTWRSGLLPGLTGAVGGGPYARASDPAVAYDAVHRVWLVATLALNPANGSALAVSRSQSGDSWTKAVIVGPRSGSLAYDKEWIVCDNWLASPDRGRCYLSYSDIAADRIATRVSTDGGLTWSAGVPAPDNAGRAAIDGRYAPGVQPVVLPSGAVVVVYYDEGKLSAISSTDGGESYAARVAIAPSSFAQPGVLRSAPLPTATVDAAGTIYAAWSGCKPRSGCRANDILLSRSTDGISWTTPQRIATGSGGDRLFPALAADETAPKRIAVTYDVRTATRLGVRIAVSDDGGGTWRRPVRLDAEPIDFGWLADAQGAMAGDYAATALAGGRAVAIFSMAAAPTRRLNQGIFAATVPG